MHAKHAPSRSFIGLLSLVSFGAFLQNVVEHDWIEIQAMIYFLLTRHARRWARPCVPRRLL